mgnify:FL=1
MPYGLPEALHEVATAKEGYVAVTGKLTFDKDKLPVTDWEQQQNTPPLTTIKARIKGKSLSKSGFQNRFDKPVMLDLRCFGPWCAGAATNKNVLAFLKQTKQGYRLNITPCGGHAFYDPKQADFNAVKQCYLKGKCPKPNQP